MVSKRALLLTASALVLASSVVAVAAPARAADDKCPDTTTWAAPKPAAWMGHAVSSAVRLPARTGACLAGVLYRPTSPSSRPRPAVVIVPPTGGGGDTQWWAAHDLAGHGFVALIVSPQGQGKSDALGSPAPCRATVYPGDRVGQQCRGVPPVTNIDNYADAVTAGIDWLTSGASPVAVDSDGIGAAGFSQGARGATLSQMTDGRVDAVVAWDNLTSDTAGDDGAPSGGDAQGALIAGQVPTSSYPITPLVPALGMASDGGMDDADVKKTAYEKWRAARMPAMQVVFKDTTHGDFAQRGEATAEQAAALAPKAAFTRGWFDLWLRGDPTTLETAAGPGWSGAKAVMDDTFHSAVFMPNLPLDCGDLATCAAPVSFRGALPAPPRAASPPSEIDLVRAYVASFQGLDTPTGPRTGTDGGAAAHRFFAQRLSAAGLSPQVQAFTLPRFAVRDASLRISQGSKTLTPKVFPLYYSGATTRLGVEAPLVDVGLGTPAEFAAADVTGKIVVIRPPTAGANPATLDSAIAASIEAKAVGLVAGIDGPGNEIAPPNTPYRSQIGALPVLLVGTYDGKRLAKLAGSKARLTLDAALAEGTTDNTYAVVPGKRAEAVIIGTPLNGWFNVASERGSGVAVVLELARRIALRGTPEYTIVIVGTGGHEIEGGGLTRFLACVPADRVVAYVHMGATVAGKTYSEVGQRVVAAHVNEPKRAIYVSENPLLATLVADAFGVHRTAQLMRPSPGGVANPGEQADAYGLGIPIAAISGNSLYFHTRSDTPDKTSQALLRPVTNAYDELLRGLLATDVAQLHAANAIADNRASAPEAKPCPAPVGL